MKIKVHEMPKYCYPVVLDDDGKVVATCRHAHRSRGAARKCGERMLKRALARRAREEDDGE